MRKEAKKTRSRIIAFLLTVCMAFSLVPTAFAASAEGFADVPSTAWYYDSVEYVVQHKYFEGTGENTFSPTIPMNRAMFVTVLARLDGAEVDDTVSAFNDVASGSWYAGAVAWAVENKIANGVGNNKFAPTQSVTRQEMAAFMLRYIEYYMAKKNVTFSAGSAKTFTDEAQISSYAQNAVALCSSYGLIDGYTDGSFGPDDTATRAQVAAVIQRLALLLETGKSDEEKQTTGSSVQVTTTESNDNKTAADFEKAAEQSGYYVTAGIDKENHLTVNDNVTIDANAAELTLNLNTATLGELTINATSETTKTTKIVIKGEKEASVSSLTINAPYATVENDVTVKGPVHIEAVSLNTFVNTAATGIITISGEGAVEDLQDDPSEVVVNTSSTVAVKGKSKEIKVVADDANLTVSPAENITPKVESSAAGVTVNVNTNNEVTIGGEIGIVKTQTTAPKLTIDGTVEKVEVSSTSGNATVEVKGTGSVAMMDTGTANVTVPEDAELSVDEVEAKGGSITAPKDTISTVKVAANASLELNAPVATVTAKAGAKLTLNETVNTIEAESNLTLAGSGEVTSIDVKAGSTATPAEITIQDASLTVTQVTKTDSSADVTVAGAGATDEIKKVVTKAAKPSVSFEKPTVAGGDGKLTGLTDKMEYKTGTGAYMPITPSAGSEMSVDPGTYQVRVKATETALASEAVIVTVPAAVGVNHAEIQGTPYVGQTLTAVANADATGTLKYQWKAGESSVGSNSKTMTITDAMIGKAITVTISNYDGQTEGTDRKTSAATDTVTVDKSTLNRLLDKAAEIRNGVTVKDNGTTASAVAEGVIFVTTSEQKALTDVITPATTVKNDNNATSTQVAGAEGNLRDANDNFIKAKKTGTRNDVTVLKEDLQAMLTSAPAEASNISGSTILINTDADKVAPRVQWVTNDVADAYSKVKGEAESARDDTNATADKLKQAITNLNDAITTYLKAIQKGAELDNSALLAAINVAEINAASVEVSEEKGKDVLPSKTWVEKDDKNTYTDKISAAKTAAAETTTQSVYNSALKTLNEATGDFNREKQAGTKDIIAPTVTNVTAALNGTTATICFTTNEAGKYSYKVASTASGDVTISTAGSVSFDVTGYDTTTKHAITVTVLDEGGNATDFTVTPSNKVVQIIRDGAALETTYETLADAIDAAQDGDTVKLLKNITLSSSVVINKNVTLDLNGHTINGIDVRALHVKSGTLTLTGTGTVTSTGSIALDSSVIRVGDGSTKKRTNVAAGLILGEKVTVDAPASYGVTAFGDTTETVTIYGTVRATAATVNKSYDGCAVATNGSIASDATINIEAGAVITATSTNAIYMPSGTLNVKGGTITGTTGIYAKSATVNVTGGTITGNGAKSDYQHYGHGGIPTGDAFVVDSCGYPGTVSVAISGGSFTSTNANAVGSYAGNNVTTAAAGFITGGTFSSDPTSYLAAGYKATKASNDSGVWTVSRKIWSDYPAGPADVSEMPSGVKITSLGEEHNHFEILLEDEEAFLYFTQVFDCSAAQQTRQAALENKTVTRYPNEYDGQYNMWWGAYTSGITVKMGCDVDLKGMTVSTVKFGGSYGPNFDGQGHTISNAKMEAASGNIGFFNGNISVSNVTFDNFTVSATGCNSAAIVCGVLTGPNPAIQNVTVKNSSVTGGRFTGAIAGEVYGDITNCKVENTVVSGQYKVGGIVGQVQKVNDAPSITQNTLTNVTVKGDNIVSGKTEFVIGKVIGCWATNGGNCTNNTFTGGTTEATANIGEVNKNYTAPQE